MNEQEIPHNSMARPPQFHWRSHVLPNDCDRVREIVTSTHFFSDAEVSVAVELVAERLAKGEASGYEFVFAEIGRQVAGYACYGPIACTVGSYDLYWIAVDRSAQRQGIGQALLERVEAQIQRQCGRHVYIETSSRPLYLPTRQFYLSQGYEVVSVLTDFYNTGDDKVTLRKILLAGD